MVAWILEYADMKPGFLIGGVPMNFGVSARLGEEPFFVVEADEYDTAFFDKRSKFVHYHPRTLIMNNLEFDHADIFDDLMMIQRQFHHLVRTIPSNGLILSPDSEQALNEVLNMGCWTPVEKTGQVANSDWSVLLTLKDGSQFDVFNKGQLVGEVTWSLTGDHNVSNGLMAIAAAHHAGVTLDIATEALCKFQNVKRRMELKGEVNDIKVYDDFAHHPTAIETTLAGLRNHVGDEKIIAVLEPRSNTMRMGIHADQLVSSLALADEVLVFVPDSLEWDASAVFDGVDNISIYSVTGDIVQQLSTMTAKGDNILVMSNGGFENIHQRILDSL
jgi:UDP-N-acetylmuramate: L-alanyl-gamma-D-glutamyl-meso-diaminopimelate ligase